MIAVMLDVGLTLIFRRQLLPFNLSPLVAVVSAMSVVCPFGGREGG